MKKICDISICWHCKLIVLNTTTDTCKECNNELGGVSYAGADNTYIMMEAPGKTIGNITVKRADGTPWIPSGG